jgi:hypothetical protein
VPTPPAKQIEVGAASVLFVFNDVHINGQPGTVRGLTVQEGSGGCLPPNCPVYDLSGAITKFPSGWGQVAFWVDPPDIDAGGSTSLHWDGPAGATYALEWGTSQGVVNIPGPTHPGALAPAGVYPGQGDPPLTPAPGITTFTLTVDESIAGSQYHAQDQKAVTVRPPPPSIAKFTGQLGWDAAGTCTLTVKWRAENAAHCLLTGTGGDQLDTVSPPEGRALPVRSPSDAAFVLTAVNDAGAQATSTLTIQWQSSQIASGVGSNALLAASPDGARLYVGNAQSLTAYSIPPAPGWPQQLYGTGLSAPNMWKTVTAAGTDGGRVAWGVYCGIETENPDGPIGYIASAVENSGLQIGPSTPWQRSIGFVAAVAPQGDALYCASAFGSSVTPFTVDAAQRTVSAGTAVPLGDTPSAGMAVASDGTLYVAGGSITAFRPTSNSSSPLQQIASWPQGQFNVMSGIAVAGDVLVIAQGSGVTLLDRHSGQPVRDAIGGDLGGSLQGVAAAPDGLRVFGVTYDGDLYGLIPGSVSGGT